jgi:hypothetical protein
MLGSNIFDKPTGRRDASDQQMVSGARARDVQQVAFGVVRLFEVRLLGDVLDAVLGRNHLVIAGHHSHGAKRQPLGQVHRSERDPAALRRDALIQ